MSKIEAGTVTNKGIVEYLIYLKFNMDGSGGNYVKKPRGLGITCAQIGNKAYPLDELEIIKSENKQ